MKLDHVHFYVTDADKLHQLLTAGFGFQTLGQVCDDETITTIVSSGAIYLVFSASLQGKGPVAKFLQSHPPGVVDIALRMPNIRQQLPNLLRSGGHLHQPLQRWETETGWVDWCQLQSWGTLRHTLVTRSGVTPLIPGAAGSKSVAISDRADLSVPEAKSLVRAVDHIVLNVARGQLATVAEWYQKCLGFQVHQRFDIQTPRSGLQSQVLVDATGQVQFPINEPTSETSQIQEFLDFNRGAGVQHIALATSDIFQAVRRLRNVGLRLLNVPPSYYQALSQQLPLRSLSLERWAAIVTHQVLVDWQDSSPALLLQTFTENVFSQPTFFFELIERQSAWVDGLLQTVTGFGERNFQALFEAMEHEQLKRRLAQGC